MNVCMHVIAAKEGTPTPLKQEPSSIVDCSINDTKNVKKKARTEYKQREGKNTLL